MTFEEALVAPGRKVQASSSKATKGMRALMIYSLSETGAKELAADMLPEAEHDALVASFTARGCVRAETDLLTDVVWVRKTGGVEVYDKKRKVLDAEGDRVTLHDGTVIARADIASLFAWASDNYVRRGIKAVLQTGKEVELVTEAAISALNDPTYSRNELLNETEWCGSLGVAIATWAGTTHESKI